VRSLAIDACPDPDVIDVQALRLPPGAPTDAGWWLGEMFGFRSPAPATRALFGLRRVLAVVVGARSRVDPAQVFAVDDADEREVMAHEADRHLDFWLGVAADGGLLQVTSVVRQHGWRGVVQPIPLIVEFTRLLTTAAVPRTRTSRAPVEATRGIHQRTGSCWV
jgi:hypothetical protein